MAKTSPQVVEPLLQLLQLIPSLLLPLLLLSGGRCVGFLDHGFPGHPNYTCWVCGEAQIEMVKDQQAEMKREKKFISAFLDLIESNRIRHP